MTESYPEPAVPKRKYHCAIIDYDEDAEMWVCAVYVGGETGYTVAGWHDTEDEASEQFKHIREHGFEFAHHDI